jgi:hypothetical protein
VLSSKRMKKRTSKYDPVGCIYRLTHLNTIPLYTAIAIYNYRVVIKMIVPGLLCVSRLSCYCLFSLSSSFSQVYFFEKDKNIYFFLPPLFNFFFVCLFLPDGRDRRSIVSWVSVLEVRTIVFFWVLVFSNCFVCMAVATR